MLEDSTVDDALRADTDHALVLTGKDVGTPILQFRPPVGVAFFGPAISRLPHAYEAGPLRDNVLGLASFPGFAELKRSLRGASSARQCRRRSHGVGRSRGLARQEPSSQELASALERGPRVEQLAVTLNDGVGMPIGQPQQQRRRRAANGRADVRPAGQILALIV